MFLLVISLFSRHNRKILTANSYDTPTRTCVHTGMHGHTKTKKNFTVVSTYLPPGRDKGNGEIRKREKITETRPHGGGLEYNQDESRYCTPLYL